MPEGDTLFRVAVTLKSVLLGQRILSCDSPLESVARAGLEGHTVTEVEARGKNLLVHFDDGRILHTHLKMHGSWHVYRVGQRWLRRSASARLVLTTQEFVAVCFGAPVVRLLTTRSLSRDPLVGQLGPDLLDPSFDGALALRNMRREGEREIGDALMHQGCVAGIGNVYKSEVLFICRTNPFVKVAALADEAIEALLTEARTQLSRNLKPGVPRITRAPLQGSRYWVYLRAGKRCFACETTIDRKRQGSALRSTYFCPTCQRVGAEGETNQVSTYR
jgi:endonuclease-8